MAPKSPGGRTRYPGTAAESLPAGAPSSGPCVSREAMRSGAGGEKSFSQAKHALLGARGHGSYPPRRHHVPTPRGKDGIRALSFQGRAPRHLSGPPGLPVSPERGKCLLTGGTLLRTTIVDKTR